jgi:hypothetical protein
MNKLPLLACVLAFATPRTAYSWGTDAHTAILDAALASLPANIRAGYDGKRRDLKKFLMEPDMRSAPVAEGSRHFIDLEKLDASYIAGLKEDLGRVYGDSGYADEDARMVTADFDAKWFAGSPPPWKAERIGPLLASLPPSITAMRASLNRMEIFCGTVVYQPYLMARALARARERNDRKAIIGFTGYLAHYTSDLFVPLHLTANYKGQYTGNPSFNDKERGDVHCRFESGFIKARLETINTELSRQHPVPEAVSMEDITRFCIKSAGETYPLAERVTTADNLASRKADPRKDWNGYLREVSPEFLPLATGQMRQASRMLAGMIIASYREPVARKQ